RAKSDTTASFGTSECVSLLVARSALPRRNFQQPVKLGVWLSGNSLELLRRYAIAANVRTQHFRDHHAAVGLLVVLDDGNPRPPNCQSAAIERVHQFRFLAAFGPVANVCPPCLEIRKVRARGNLAEETLSRQPHFDVIGLGRRETQVGG